MQNRTFASLSLVALLATALVASPASAQPGGRGGPGGWGGAGGMGGGLLGLLRIEAVQQELETLPDQLEKAAALGEELRGDRPAGDWRNMSEEDRAQAMEQMRERAAQQAVVVREKLGEILLPHQMKRLEQLSLQQRGIRALTDAQVVKELKLSAQVVEQINAQLEENQTAMREQMREIMQGGNRETARERLAEMRDEMDSKVLGKLTDAQKAAWKSLQGEDFEFPQFQFGAPGGRGQQQQQGGRGAGRGRADDDRGGRQRGAGGRQRGPDA
jgi:hypothetical protein